MQCDMIGHLKGVLVLIWVIKFAGMFLMLEG